MHFAVAAAATKCPLLWSNAFPLSGRGTKERVPWRSRKRQSSQKLSKALAPIPSDSDGEAEGGDSDPRSAVVAAIKQYSAAARQKLLKRNVVSGPKYASFYWGGGLSLELLGVGFISRVGDRCCVSRAGRLFFEGRQLQPQVRFPGLAQVGGI